MARILFTWELGGGLGHMTGLRPIAAELLQRGHKVDLALRDLVSAQRVFGDLDVGYWQAPIKLMHAADFAPPTAFVNLLALNGLGCFEEISALATAWRAVFQAVRPDLVVCEHSPVALLAARGYDARRVLCGSGFFCPPPGPTLPVLRPWAKPNLDLVRQDEEIMLAHVNQMLDAWRLPLLSNLGQLYYDVDATLLTTLAELDHFGPRSAGRYWGVGPFVGGQPFHWPSGCGPRIYAYLRPSSALPALLGQLGKWRFPTMVYADGIDSALELQLGAASLQFARSPLDLRQAAAECDLAITNGNHATLVTLLLAGKPSLNLPPYLEQNLLARRLQHQGYGEIANPYDTEATEQALRRMLDSEGYANAAQRFALKYRHYDPHQSILDLSSRLESLLA